MMPNATGTTTPEASRSISGAAYSATAMETAAAAAELEIQSDQPTMKPAKGPKTFRANTY